MTAWPTHPVTDHPMHSPQPFSIALRRLRRALVVNSVLAEQHLTPRLRRENRIRTIQASLAMENNTLTLEQVTSLMDELSQSCAQCGTCRADATPCTAQSDPALPFDRQGAALVAPAPDNLMVYCSGCAGVAFTCCPAIAMGSIYLHCSGLPPCILV
jgi:hypothetical protein